MADIVSNSSFNKQQEKEKILTENIYQNLESEDSTEVAYAKVLKQRPIETTIAQKKSPVPPPIPPVKVKQESTTAQKISPMSNPHPTVNDKQDPGSKSVKDLVKRFNHK
jgi:hypothetical protein